MGRNRACDIDDHRRPKRDLMAQQPELVLPCSTPRDGEWSALVAQLLENTGDCPSHAAAAGGDQSRGNKRKKEMKCGGKEKNAKPHPHGTKRRKLQQTKTLVTTVPDYDGYQWRKYGQKQIEGAKYPRSYFRCTSSTDQGCLAKRTVQRNDDGKDGPPVYTVVYIMEHTCKMNDSVEPVILETSPQNTVAVHAYSTTSTSSRSTESPPILDGTCSDSMEHELYERLFADDRSPRPASLPDELDFAGPIMSPLHTMNGWIDELLDGPIPCHLFALVDLDQL